MVKKAKGEGPAGGGFGRLGCGEGKSRVVKNEQLRQVGVQIRWPPGQVSICIVYLGRSSRQAGPGGCLKLQVRATISCS